MKDTTLAPPVTFFHTLPMPCPYLSGQVERRLVADISSRRGRLAHDTLSRAGFRRSQNLIYRPACPGCNACVPIRVRARDFRWTKSFRRAIQRNSDLTGIEQPLVATREQYDLFNIYQKGRHTGGEMGLMDFADYSDMIERSSVDSSVIEYRGADEKLVAAILMDRLDDGLSAVYSFFETDATDRGLGTFMVLDLVRRAAAKDLNFVYLGYWIEECRKMSYKVRFRPAEGLSGGLWQEIDQA